MDSLQIRNRWAKGIYTINLLATQTRYSPLVGFAGGATTEPPTYTVMPNSGHVLAIYMNITTNTTTVPTSIQLRKNGVNLGSALSIGAGVTGAVSSTGLSLAFSAGDNLDYQLINTDPAGNVGATTLMTEIGQ